MKQFFKFMFASCAGVLLSSIIVFIGLIIFISGIISSTTKPDTNIKDNSVLVIKIDKPVYDREVSDVSSMFSQSNEDFDLSSSIGLTEFIQTIHNAKDDDHIKAIMLDLSQIQANGWATINDMRQALMDFRQSGKKVYAYSDTYAQNAYYLATSANEIYLSPAGRLMLTGIGGNVMYIKDLVEKLDVDVALVRPQSNAFKSAGEMFTKTSMTKENREQTKAYTGYIWSFISEQMAKARRIDINTFNTNVSHLEAFVANDALRNKYVDKLAFRTDLKDKIAADLKNEDINFVSYKKYRASLGDIFKIKKGNIAVIYAYGDVVQGEGSDLQIGGETITQQIRKAAKNDRIKAIVLRVNSSGGDALASEMMTNEVIKAKKLKPVIVSMGDVAASAGYEMSSNATKIVCSPITITGSIGVFGVMPNFQRALKTKLGIGFDTIKTNDNSTFMSVVTPPSKEQMFVMQKGIEDFYRNFVHRVATGRGLSDSYVANIARGRVWIGASAKQLKLVDAFGGLETAIQLAANEAKIKDYGIIMLPKTADIPTQLIKANGGQRQIRVVTQQLGKPYAFFLDLQHITQMQGVQMRLPYIMLDN